MNEFLAVKSPEPYQELLFPQEFRDDDATRETIEAHIALADWTIGALERAIEKLTDTRDAKIRNDRNAVQGTRKVLEQRIDSK